MRVIGWALKDGRGHAHILALCGDGTVVMREWLHNDWRIWNDQTLNEGSLQIQNAIQSWEDAGYDRGEPLHMDTPVDKVDLTNRFHDRAWMDRLFLPFLVMGGISPPDLTGYTTFAASHIASTAPSLANVGDIWFDTSAATALVYNGSSWMQMKGAT
jgi:hypothetical protein